MDDHERSLDRAMTTVAPDAPPGEFGDDGERTAVGAARIEVHTDRIVRANARFCDLLGFSEADLRARTLDSLSHPDDIGLILARMRQQVSGEPPAYAMEQRFVRRDDTVVRVLLTVSPMWLPGAAPDFSLVVAEDITARR